MNHDKNNLYKSYKYSQSIRRKVITMELENNKKYPPRCDIIDTLQKDVPKQDTPSNIQKIVMNNTNKDTLFLRCLFLSIPL